MSRLRTIIVFIIYTSVLGISSAQYPTRIKYGTKDGLNSAETYGCFMSHDSSLFIKMYDHIVEYNGYRFEKLSQMDKIIGSEPARAYFLLEDETIIGMDSLYSYKEGQWRNIGIELNIELQSYGQNLYLHKDTLMYRRDSSLYAYARKERKFKEYAKIPRFVLDSFQMEEISGYRESFDGEYLFLRRGNDYKNYKKEKDSYRRLNKKEDFKVFYDYVESIGLAVELEIQSLFRYLLPKTVHYIEEDIINQKYFIGDDLYDFYYRPSENAFIAHQVIKDVEHFIRSASNSEMEFHAGHQGVTKIDHSIQYLKSGEQSPFGLHTISQLDSGKMLFGGYQEGLAQWDGDSLEYIGIQNKPLSAKRILPGSLRLKDGSILLSCEAGMILFREGQANYLDAEVDGTHVRGYYIDSLADGSIAIGLNKMGLGIVDSFDHRIMSIKAIDDRKGLALGNVLSFAEDFSGRIWSTGGKGVALYVPDQDTAFTYLKSSDIGRGIGAICSEVDELGNLWFGTAKGIRILEKAHQFSHGSMDFFSSLRKLTLPNADSSMIGFIKQVDRFLIIGSQKAVSFLDLDSYYSQPESPVVYQLIYGEDIQGGGSEQNAVLRDDQNRIWIGSQEGVSYIDWDNFHFDSSKPKIEISKCLVGGNFIDPGKELILPSFNRNCSIYFGLEKNPTLKKNVFFDYYLLFKGDTLMHDTYEQDGIFRREQFDPGEYTLSVIAKKHGQNIDEINYKICVPRTLQERWWFWPLWISLIITAIAYYFYSEQSKKRITLQNKLKLAQSDKDREKLQVQAIISSFNPHFINNSLHWISLRYRKDDLLVKLIGNLAGNIREVFLHTRQGNVAHSLESELNLVKNYVEIQKIRFGEHFQFSIFNKLTSMHWPILLMHIQLHVENAIEHGIRNREGASSVNLSLSEDAQYIYMVIEDDGIGRPAARKIKSSGTQSATQMIKELMKIFNKHNKLDIDQFIEDEIKQDSEGLPYGTKVYLKYPKYYSYELI